MKNVVKVDAELADLMPVYLQSRREELARIAGLLKAGDFSALQTIGHKLHGSGGGFGLDFLTDLGMRMESSAQAGDKSAFEEQAAELKDFLDSVEIEFLPEE